MRRGNYLMHMCKSLIPCKIDSRKKRVSELIQLILHPTTKNDVVIASMNELYEIAKNDPDIVTTKNMQQLKTCKNWDLIQTKYSELYQDLNADVKKI
jgi:hypothetical protein